MFTHKIWCAMVIVALMALLVPSAAAQDPSAEVIARVDQAMAHLSTFLNGTNVSRLTNAWTFEARTFNDTSYGCPAAGQVYAQQLVEGYFIKITANGIDYTYHTNRDGTVLILCFQSQPHPSSLGIGSSTTPPSTNPALPTTQALPASDWYAVVFNRTADTLHWLNADGQQAVIERPKLPNEALIPSAKVQLSRDGRFLAVAASLDAGGTGLGFYDLEMGWWIKTHAAQRNEVIELGGRYSSNAASNQMAVGLYTVSATANWRVIVFDLPSGDAVYQMVSIEDEARDFIQETLNQTEVYRPVVVYFDYDDFAQKPIIHIQFVVLGSIPPDVPSLAWYPTGIPGLDNQTLTPSPYQRRGIDFNPSDGLAVFPHVDPTTPVLQTGNPSTQFNAVAVGSPLALSGYPGPFVRFSIPILGIGTTLWGANGETILFQAINEQSVTDWYSTDTGITADPVRPPAQGLIGTPSGYVLHGQDGNIYSDGGDLLLAGTGLDLQMVWATIDETPFGLTQVVADTGLFYEPRPAPEGPVGPPVSPDATQEVGSSATSLCPDAPPSRVAVGSLAIVSFAGIPLNVRDVPGGNRIAQLEDGTALTVNGGPQCQGVYTWWRIAVPTTGVSGWVAEGDANRYYIEPNQRFQER